jgi:hypothetical protein
MLLLNGYSHPKERWVVELRKEGKNYRQIAKEAQVSPRDIKLILHKYGVDGISGNASADSGKEDSDSFMPISTKAYKLFSEEMMTPIEVAMALHIEAPEAMKYHDEFLELNGRGILAKLFKELDKGGISWLLRLCAIVKTKKMSINQVIECVSIYDEDLPMIKQLREDANNDLEAVQNQVFQCEHRVEYMNHLTDKLADDVKSKQTECERLDKIRMEIIGQTLRLRRFISGFKNHNITYEKIEQFVEDKVDSILRDNMQLLRLGLISLLRSLGKDEAYKYRYLLHELNLIEIPGSVDDISIDDMSITHSIARSSSNAIVVRNNPKTMGSVDRYQHSNRQSKTDHCPACFQSSILTMSNEYFENLKQLITDDVMSALLEEKAYFSSKIGV